MSPSTRVTRVGLRKGEREIGPAIVVEQTTNHPLDQLVARLKEALTKKGKKELLVIKRGLMDDVEAPVLARLKEEFPNLVAGEGFYTQGRYPSEAAWVIKETTGATKEDLCSAIYRRHASPNLELDEMLKRQFLGVILDEVDKFWPKEEKK